MAKYINADDCFKYFWEHLNDEAIPGAMNAIEEMPEAIVRCKDCEFYNPKANVGYLAYCDLAGEYEHLDPEWYCCHAERRESE